jgi:hypothetical protein
MMETSIRRVMLHVSQANPLTGVFVLIEIGASSATTQRRKILQSQQACIAIRP